MVLFLSDNRQIIAYNELISDLTNITNKNAVVFNGVFPMDYENKDGQKVLFYLNEDNATIRIEYEAIPERPKNDLENILMCLNKSQDEIRQEGADLLMTELQQRGIISLHNAGGYCLTSNLFNWYGGVAA